ncbi:MAG: rod shape-determining protein MreD [Deltaproteobacteria bacterium]|nr:rod shape-determining protein MreD [Deltaproteobacteria bacterium]
MRHLAVIGLGIILLTVTGAVCRVLHTEWVRPDPILILVVYISIFMKPGEGVLTAFVLGAIADSFASTPWGMLMSASIVVWMFARHLRRFMQPNQSTALVGVMFITSLLFSMLIFVYLAAMGASDGVIWVNLKAVLPLAFINAVLAVPVWSLAKLAWPPTTRRRFEMAV